MFLLRCLIFLTLLTVGFCRVGSSSRSNDDTPIGKVIKLITDLRDKVKSDGEAEATVYTQFAEDCKDKTQEKTDEITQATDDIGDASANLAALSSRRDIKETLLADIKGQIEKLNKDFEDTKNKCAADWAADDAALGRITKAHAECRYAIKRVCSSAKAKGETVDDCTKAGHVFLLQKAGGSQKLHDLRPEDKAVVAAMMQGQGSSIDLSAALASSSHEDLIGALVSMRKEFEDQEAALDEKMKTEEKVCNAALHRGKPGSFPEVIPTKIEERDSVSGDIELLVTDIGTSRGDVVKYQAILANADEYMKDLTTECQSRARDWDQRSSMRNDEVHALQTALDVLTGKVQEQANTVNKRVMFQSAMEPDEAVPPSQANRGGEMQEFWKILGSGRNQDLAVQKPIALVREGVVQTSEQSRSKSFLESAQEARKTKALQKLAAEGQRLGSLAIVELAQSARKDAFSKVKDLVDHLIRRLIHEATSESSKQAFCDGELAKAHSERDFRWSKAKKLMSKIQESEEHAEELMVTCDQLANTTLPNLAKSLKEGTDLRKQDKDANMETLKTAKGALSALQSAMKTLKDFYNKASKASFIQPSIITGDLKDAGFKGLSKGSQASSHAIFGLLETIESDFRRTLRTTESSEKQSARDWARQSRDIAVSTSEGEATLKLSTQELVSTKADIKIKTVDLTNAQGLLDNALKELAKLAPTCIDSGMSYETRTAKRDAEMKALQTALCQLDEVGVEESC